MKAKKIIITTAFVLLMLGLKAQTDFAYSTISYTAVGPYKYIISISKEGKYETSDGKVSEGSASTNISPAMEVLDKMSKEGWETVTSSMCQSTLGMVYYFFLRRKK